MTNTWFLKFFNWHNIRCTEVINYNTATNLSSSAVTLVVALVYKSYTQCFCKFYLEHMFVLAKSKPSGTAFATKQRTINIVYLNIFWNIAIAII